MIPASKNFFNCVRRFHRCSILRIDTKNVEEVKIPVPWGHIAGKWWGSKETQPILAIHGWQDNAGSWDPFAEKLSSKYSLLAIDIPGNGFSSPIPPLQNYYFIDSVHFIKKIKNYYGFDKLNLLGHSGGSAASFMYATVCPDDVKSLFGIDYLLYSYKNEQRRAAAMGSLIDKKITLALRDSAKSKVYKREDAMKAWVQGTRGSVSPKSAEILMKRGVVEKNDGVMFNRDHRLKASDLLILHTDQILKFVQFIKCDMALVKASKSKFFDQGIKYCPNILEEIKKLANSYEFHTVEGNHHLHMDIPETIVDIYEKFRTKVL